VNNAHRERLAASRVVYIWLYRKTELDQENLCGISIEAKDCYTARTSMVIFCGNKYEFLRYSREPSAWPGAAQFCLIACLREIPPSSMSRDYTVTGLPTYPPLTVGSVVMYPHAYLLLPLFLSFTLTLRYRYRCATAFSG